MFTRREGVRRALVAYLGLAKVQRRSFAQTVAGLGAVQMDPMRVVAPAHLLTIRLRRGPTSETAFSRALSAGSLVEVRLKERCIIASQDLPAAAARFARARARRQLADRGLEGVASEILAALARGPRFSRQIGSEHRVASFWDEDPRSMKATTMALDILAEEGRVIVTARRRGERRYDLPDRMFPQMEHTVAEPATTRLFAALHYGRTMGLFRASDPYLGWSGDEARGRRQVVEDMLARRAWVELRIDDVDQTYLCASEFAELLEDPPTVRGVRLLSPLDNLLWDRRRLRDVFDFEYTWEAYTPATRRKVGPYGMPVLLDGRLIGEVDARRDVLGVLRWRLVERQAVRVSDRRRIGRAVDRLAADLGVQAAPVQQVELSRR